MEPTATERQVVVSRNPADLDDVVAEVEQVGAEGFVAACRAARAAQPAWAATPAPVRGRAIQLIGRLVEENKEALARLVTREIGKPYAESLGEVQEIVDTCDFFVSEGRRLYGQTVPSEMPDKQLFTFRMPVGVAAVITAGNFPVAVPAWYLVPALLCGNTVVWKPADYTPALGEALTQLFQHGGLPEGVLNLVQADGPSTFAGLEAALEEGVLDKVGFTGSSEVGRRIGELCGRHLQSPCLELGGKNPLVVMPDAELDLAVEGSLFSGFGTAGQRCTSLGTAIVHESVYDEFLSRFTRAVEEAPIGDPTKDVLYGPMIHERFHERFQDWLGLIRDHHSVSGSTATGPITSASPREGFVGDPDRGIYCHPTIVAGVTADDELYDTETFGPLVGVARFGDFDEAVALANGHGYGLSAAIYTTDPQAAFRFRERVSAGMLSINNSTSGAEAHLPFGGNGRSGNGSRQSGIWVLDQFTRWQSVNWDYAGKLQKAQMDTAEIEADMSFRLPGVTMEGVERSDQITPQELRLATRNHGLPLEALAYDVTPAGLHYLLVHYDIPVVDPAGWRLEVGGEVGRKLSLSLDDLRRRPSTTLAVTMECAGNGRSLLSPRPLSQPWLLEAVGTAEWTGTPLRGLLEDADVGDGAIEVLFRGGDRGIEGDEEQQYERSLPLADALRDEVLLAYEMNGEPLPPQHGFPLRLVVPGWYGMTSVKWLEAIEVLDQPFEGYQQARGYRMRQTPEEPGEPVSRMVPRSLMVPPGIPDFATRVRTVAPGSHRVTGRAWSGLGRVVRVEFSDDGGQSWTDCRLGPEMSEWAWRAWECDWQVREPGHRELCCRATDDAGNVQPLEAPWNLGGYANNAVQRVPVEVAAA